MKACLAAMAKLAGGGLALAAEPDHVSGHTIVQMGRAFHPAEVTIGVGQALTFTNNDNYIHQVYVTGLFDSEEKAPGEDLTESFPTAGTFEVRCHIHPKMKLTVHVK